MARLRQLRETAGLTQVELAHRAGVSRQLVGAVESGRHLPRVDAALALAAALGVEVDDLFAAGRAPVDVVSGIAPSDGAAVRVGRVGDLTVTAPARLGTDGFDAADGVVDGDEVTAFGRLAPGFVVAGCEPGLVVVERILREGGMAAVAASASSAAASDALRAGRVHAAVVHGPGTMSPPPVSPPPGSQRFHLAQWRVGLAGRAEAGVGWWQRALTGTTPVIQRENGAGVQRSFLDAAASPAPGPVVNSHMEAAQLALATGLAGVTIEPVALALGLEFHPLEVHTAQLWVDAAWQFDRTVTTAFEAITSRRFRRRLERVGGYDLERSGERAA